MKRLTTEEFIKNAREVHGNKYDYSKTEYKNYNTKVCIICPEHGEFWQTPGNHLKGKGCNKCATIIRKKSRLLTTEIFIEKARKVHGNKYDYSKVNYINNNTPVCVICPEHGEFWQKPIVHLMGSGCQNCCKSGVKLTQEEFIKRAREIHGDKYDYSNVKYKNMHNKVCIICHKKDIFNKEHGEFWQTPASHLKSGCPKCANKNITTEDFIAKAKKVHGDKYDYSKVEYKNCDIKVCIICPEHGEFWQTPSKHLLGQSCPYCKRSLLEEKVEKFLKKYKINFVKQQTFQWLKMNKNLFLDFYLPDYNIAIECQGKQHFLENCCFGHRKMDKLEITQKRDKTKYNLCLEHNIKMIYFSELNIDYPYHVVTNQTDLLIEILQSIKRGEE